MKRRKKSISAKKKFIICLCAAAVIAAGFLIAFGFSDRIVASGTGSDGLTWTLSRDFTIKKSYTLTISGDGDMEVFESPDDIPWSCYYESEGIPTSQIRHLIIEDGVASISRWAFSGMEGVTDISLPEGITYIGEAAFCGCHALEEIILPSSVTLIGDDAFEACVSLSEITIPEGVTEIGIAVFLGCTLLEKVYIPESVTYIGDSAFGVCSNLKYIYYEGTQEQWEQIEISTFNNSELSSVEIYYESYN